MKLSLATYGAIALYFYASLLPAANTVVRFDPSAPDVGPYPTNFLTTADPAQKTGIRVNLPLPDCQAQATSCQQIALINQLDGFNMQARLRVRFSAAINSDTLRSGIFWVWLDNLTQEEYGLQKAGHLTPINQVIYDPQTSSAYAKPDEFFDQHRNYAIIVTNAVKDSAGDPVKSDPAFDACITAQSPTPYCAKLASALPIARSAVPGQQIVAASVYTTLSVTDWLEKARQQLQFIAPDVQPTGMKSIFNISDIASAELHNQLTAANPTFDSTPLPNTLLTSVGSMAFGSYQSPLFLNENLVIPQVPTAGPVAVPVASNRIQFHVYLPSTPKPSRGYPVAIVGHGFGSGSYLDPTGEAGSLARAGFATIAINAFGHGYGPQSRFTITDRSGTVTDIPTGGRGVLVNPNGTYGPYDGCVLPTIATTRDCVRQTVVDLMQLVRAIQIGIDVDGDQVPDLDGTKISYTGLSLGAIYGTILTAVEPAVQNAALVNGGGTIADIARFSPAFHDVAVRILGSQQPSLLNAGADFQENYPLRYRPVMVNTRTGAIPIQEFFELIEWYGISGDGVGYATHLFSSTLPGNAIKPTLFAYAYGDLTIPNNTETDLVRAANLRETTRFYRHDLARKAVPGLPVDPHIFLFGFDSTPALAISLASQQMVAGFLQSGGTTIPDTNNIVRPIFGVNLFEAPSFLTEDLNF